MVWAMFQSFLKQFVQQPDPLRWLLPLSPRTRFLKAWVMNDSKSALKLEAIQGHHGAMYCVIYVHLTAILKHICFDLMYQPCHAVLNTFPRVYVTMPIQVLVHTFCALRPSMSPGPGGRSLCIKLDDD
jgi:hypothetical protein